MKHRKSLVHRIHVGLALGLALLGAGCSQTHSASLANPVGPTAAVLTLSGVVLDDGGRPIANALVRIQIPCGATCVRGSQALSDATGRYAIGIGDLPGAEDIWAVAYKDGYVQPCAATTTVFLGSASLDVKLSSMANLLARPLLGPGMHLISGAVFEESPIRRPVEGAGVLLSGGGNYAYDEFAYTRTDTSGRYVLCGLPWAVSYVTAHKEGYRSSFGVASSGADASVDIEIARQ